MWVRERHAGRNSILLLLLSLALACGGPSDEEIGPAEAPLVEVLETSEKKWRETLELTAEVLPWAAVTVASEVAGRVVELPVDEGDSVERGQVVARLDGADARAQLAQAEARLASSRATLSQAERDLERGRSLVEGDGLISEDELDRLEVALEVARASLLEAEAGLLVSRERLDDTTLLAPFSGVVGRREVEVGSWVGPGQALLRVVGAERLKVRGSASQRDRVGLEVGDPVVVEARALPGARFEGKIRALGQEADRATGTYAVEAEVPAPAEEQGPGLLPGMNAVLSVELEARRGVVIPETAVLGAAGSSIVYVVEDGIARRRPVEIEVLDGGEVVVLEGLSAGEDLVVRGQHGLEDGVAVDVK